MPTEQLNAQTSKVLDKIADQISAVNGLVQSCFVGFDPGLIKMPGVLVQPTPGAYDYHAGSGKSHDIFPNFTLMVYGANADSVEVVIEKLEFLWYDPALVIALNFQGTHITAGNCYSVLPVQYMPAIPSAPGSFDQFMGGLSFEFKLRRQAS